jgi:choice-of-anchor B domain-containing protein
MKSLSQKLLIFLLFLNCAKDSEIDQSPSVIDCPDTGLSNDTSDTDNSFGYVPCENGMAGIYPCQGYNLLSRVTLEEFNSQTGNDNWGWTDPETGIEYVLNGLDDGVGFVSIEDPVNPVYLGKLPTATDPSPWRDVKVYNNHAFIVSEAQNHGLQVFDLTRLRGLTEVQSFTEDAVLNDLGNAHNIAINEDTGFAYVVGSQLYNGGPVFININDPKNPSVTGGFEAASYTHDAQIVVYQGPDLNYTGKELLFASNSDGGANNKVVILDVTDKENPEWIQSITYENGGYTHQGYLSEDQRYFLLGDELDELNFGSPTSTKIFDLSDLSNPKLHLNYFAGVNAIDHNGYTKGDQFFIASYTAGLRVLDISGIDEKKVEEMGYFDTYPVNNNAAFTGAWNVYPYFESGVIAINDINSGLFLVKASED